MQKHALNWRVCIRQFKCRDTLEELDEEQSALKKERKTLSLNIQAIQAELEFALDIVEKSLLQEELDALISLKDEQQNECKELHSEHRSIKKELRYLVELTNNETSVEEGWVALPPLK